MFFPDIFLLVIQEGPHFPREIFFRGKTQMVVPDLSESPGGLVKTWMAGPQPQSRDSAVGDLSSADEFHFCRIPGDVHAGGPWVTLKSHCSGYVALRPHQSLGCPWSLTLFW